MGPSRRPPGSASEVDARYLEPLVRDFLADPGAVVTDVRATRLGWGTSGARLHRIAVRARGRSDPIRLVLKVDAAHGPNEAWVYAGLARRMPIDTPRVLDARALPDGCGWILMEELPGAKPAARWTPSDLSAVVRDMARLHAAHWSQPLEDFPWLSRPDARAIGQELAAMRSSLAAIEEAGLPHVLPEIVSVARARWISRVLDHAEAVVGPLLAAGTTIVHGDYWFHNVQLLPDGRRVLLDWQSCRVFSGLWELVYFIDLWHVTGRRSFRVRVPALERQVVEWYRESLREWGVEVPSGVFREALDCAAVWHPLAHWLTRYGRMAQRALAAPGWRAARAFPAAGRVVACVLASRNALRFMEATWERWEHQSRHHLSAAVGLVP